MIPQHPIVGTSFRENQANATFGAAPTPHNLFLNALLYHWPRLAFSIAIAIAGLQVRLAWTVWKVGWLRKDFLAIGSATGHGRLSVELPVP